MKKNDVKIISNIITAEFNKTKDFLLIHNQPVNNTILRKYVLNIRNNIIICCTNQSVSLTNKEKEFIAIMLTSNITNLVRLINKCSENVTSHYIAMCLNTTRDRCVKALHEYYSEQIHTEITEAIEHLVKLYSDMVS